MCQAFFFPVPLLFSRSAVASSVVCLSNAITPMTFPISSGSGTPMACLLPNTLCAGPVGSPAPCFFLAQGQPSPSGETGDWSPLLRCLGNSAAWVPWSQAAVGAGKGGTKGRGNGREEDYQKDPRRLLKSGSSINPEGEIKTASPALQSNRQDLSWRGKTLLRAFNKELSSVGLSTQTPFKPMLETFWWHEIKR